MLCCRVWMSGSSAAAARVTTTHWGCAGFEECSLENNSQPRHFAVNKHSHHIDRSILNITAANGSSFLRSTSEAEGHALGEKMEVNRL